MASRISYAVSVTPVYTHAEGEGLSTDVLATDIGKTLGGSADVSSTPSYANAALATEAKTGSGAALVTTPTSCKGLFVRNTGLDENGSSTTATVTVIAASTNLCVLDPGGAIFFPSIQSSLAITVTISSGQVQIEHAVLN